MAKSCSNLAQFYQQSKKKKQKIEKGKKKSGFLEGKPKSSAHAGCTAGMNVLPVSFYYVFYNSQPQP